MAVEIRCIPSDDERFCEAVATALAGLPELPTPALGIVCRRRLDAIRDVYPRAEVRLGGLHGRERHVVFAFRDGSPSSSQTL